MSTSTPSERLDLMATSEGNSTEATERGLSDLARLIVAASKQQITPVLVTVGKLRFTSDFYGQLCSAVHQHSGCHVRLELLPEHRLGGRSQAKLGLIGLLGGQKSATQQLNRELPSGCSAVQTLVLARNQQPLSEVVIGFAGPHDHLPSYAKSIELCS